MLFYRFSDLATENLDVLIFEHQFELIKETKCGYWIGDSLGKHWVSKTSKKRFAYPTRKEAIESFIARKKQQIRYMKIKAKRAEVALEKGLKLLFTIDESE
jgi:hypothetical protein